MIEQLLVILGALGVAVLLFGLPRRKKVYGKSLTVDGKIREEYGSVLEDMTPEEALDKLSELGQELEEENNEV